MELCTKQGVPGVDSLGSNQEYFFSSPPLNILRESAQIYIYIYKQFCVAFRMLSFLKKSKYELVLQERSIERDGHTKVKNKKIKQRYRKIK